MTKGHTNFIEFCKNCEESERGLDGEIEREREGGIMGQADSICPNLTFNG